MFCSIYTSLFFKLCECQKDGLYFSCSPPDAAVTRRKDKRMLYSRFFFWCTYALACVPFCYTYSFIYAPKKKAWLAASEVKVNPAIERLVRKLFQRLSRQARSSSSLTVSSVQEAEIEADHVCWLRYEGQAIRTKNNFLSSKINLVCTCPL